MTAVDGYDVLELLGGTRARVHRAVQRDTGRVVVLKQASWDRTDVVEALAREAGVLERVQHPSLMRLVQLVDDVVGRTLVLPNMPGGDLERRLAADGAMAATDAADLGARLAEALATLHRAGIVHRDVHPGNVLVDAELVPVLADLDHALDPAAPPLAQDGEVVGHAEHIDPRLFDGASPGPLSDLHGLASTVWAAATGGAPRRGDLLELPASPALPPRLRATITACLDGSIGDAAAAAHAFHAAALDAAGWRPSPAADTAPTPPPPPPAPSAMPPPSAEVRVAALAGGGAGGSRPGTRRWGPAPVPAGPRSVAEPARRALWLVAAVLLLVIPVAMVLLQRDDEVPSTIGVLPTPSSPDTPVAVAPPPPCPGSSLGPGAVAADLTGEGCSVGLQLEDGVLRVPGGAYEVGRAGDVLLAGDWDGDGAWSPGLYRPDTGEVFLFDTVPDGAALTSQPALQRTPGGVPVVTDADADGVHEVTVSGAPG